MTIQHALDFINRGQHDEQLRCRLEQASGYPAIEAILGEECIPFSEGEFEEAYSLSLFKCQDQSQAQALMAFRMWWLLLIRSPAQPVKRPAEKGTG